MTEIEALAWATGKMLLEQLAAKKRTFFLAIVDEDGKPVMTSNAKKHLVPEFLMVLREAAIKHIGEAVEVPLPAPDAPKDGGAA